MPLSLLTSSSSPTPADQEPVRRPGRHRQTSRRTLRRAAAALAAGIGMLAGSSGAAQAVPVPAAALVSSAFTTPFVASSGYYYQPLEYGDYGPDVAWVQSLLGVSPRTGYFGPLTQAAVLRFQARVGLETVGYVGPRTWAALQRLDLARIGTVVNPMPADSYVLTGFFEEYGGPWGGSGHKGLDLAAPTGTRVGAVAAGSVVDAGWYGACGYRVVVKHSDGTHTWYCHLSHISVWSGWVRAGAKIGEVGSTGEATGPHLHLAVRIPDGSAGLTTVDPLSWLRRHRVNV